MEVFCDFHTAIIYLVSYEISIIIKLNIQVDVHFEITKIRNLWRKIKGINLDVKDTVHWHNTINRIMNYAQVNNNLVLNGTAYDIVIQDLAVCDWKNKPVNKLRKMKKVLPTLDSVVIH